MFQNTETLQSGIKLLSARCRLSVPGVVTLLTEVEPALATAFDLSGLAVSIGSDSVVSVHASRFSDDAKAVLWRSFLHNSTKGGTTIRTPWGDVMQVAPAVCLDTYEEARSLDVDDQIDAVKLGSMIYVGYYPDNQLRKMATDLGINYEWEPLDFFDPNSHERAVVEFPVAEDIREPLQDSGEIRRALMSTLAWQAQERFGDNHLNSTWELRFCPSSIVGLAEDRDLFKCEFVFDAGTNRLTLAEHHQADFKKRIRGETCPGLRALWMLLGRPFTFEIFPLEDYLPMLRATLDGQQLRLQAHNSRLFTATYGNVGATQIWSTEFSVTSSASLYEGTIWLAPDGRIMNQNLSSIHNLNRYSETHQFSDDDDPNHLWTDLASLTAVRVVRQGGMIFGMEPRTPLNPAQQAALESFMASGPESQLLFDAATGSGHGQLIHDLETFLHQVEGQEGVYPVRLNRGERGLFLTWPGQVVPLRRTQGGMEVLATYSFAMTSTGLTWHQDTTDFEAIDAVVDYVVRQFNDYRQRIASA